MLSSPCDGNCKLNYTTKVCMGCFRTMDEILRWISLTDGQKQEILKSAEERKLEYNKSSGKIS
ncbi:MAG: hypothetical protein A2068_07945 [Ignavibacteria bacterium GWB2_35_6b]|nr:MAG: hypothetical protein A2068_07945 [Ignavibacteria bacterium GWB2_35_6b]